MKVCEVVCEGFASDFQGFEGASGGALGLQGSPLAAGLLERLLGVEDGSQKVLSGAPAAEADTCRDVVEGFEVSAATAAGAFLDLFLRVHGFPCRSRTLLGAL